MTAANVILIGFMGAGKSTIGAELGRLLGWHVIDTDRLVEGDAGKTVEEIWASEGEEGFRRYEERAVVRACAGTERVICCGGGAVLRMRNYGILKGAGMVVYLRASAEALRDRLGDGRGRPLLSSPEAFDRLLAERIPAYEAAAGMIVDTDDRSVTEVAGEIATAVRA